MSKRIPKTVTDVNIWVYGKDNKVKGRFILSSGNIFYYRKNAKKETVSYTYQQLMDLIEDNIKP